MDIQFFKGDNGDSNGTQILHSLEAREVSLVPKGANRRPFLIRKSAQKRTTADLLEEGLGTPLTEAEERIITLELKQREEVWEEIRKCALSRVEKSERSLTEAQAIDEFLQTNEGKRLYQKYID